MQFKNNSILMIAVAVALAALPGCGGGGGGGGGNNGGGGVTPSTTLHTMAAGNTWTYTLSGTATSPGQTTSQVSGNITRSIQTESLNGATLGIREVSTYTFTGGGLNGGGGGGQTDTFFIQDGNFNVYETGQSSTPDGGGTTTQTVSTPSAANDTIIPGAWAKGDVTSANISYTDASSLMQTFDVVSAQNVAVPPVGTFPAWNVSVAINGGTAEPEQWDPTMGTYLTNRLVQLADFGGHTWTITTTATLATSTTAG